MAQVAAVSAYVPGYELVAEPQFDDPQQRMGRTARGSPSFSRSRVPGTSYRHMPAILT